MKLSIKIFCLHFFLRIILYTCSWKTKNIECLNKEIKSNKSIMLACWHENLVFLSCFFKGWPKNNFWVISSTHKDSEILANILSSWKYKLIKGSSTRGWLPVLKKLIKLFSAPGNIVAITNDGPRGPARKSKPGALKIALQKNVSIVGMKGSASSFWTLNSWDRLKIPKPFSTITISFSDKYSGVYNLDEFNSYLNNIQ